LNVGTAGFWKKYPANFTMGAFSSYLGPTIGTPF